MLEVKDLHCSYGTTQVLKGVDITVNKGEVISILGSSGSGKTTLLRCISFLQKADSGTIRFDDFEKDITKLKHSEVRALRMKMGYVFQNFNLFRNMTVKQNVLEGLITARGVDRATAETERADTPQQFWASGGSPSFPHTALPAAGDCLSPATQCRRSGCV